MSQGSIRSQDADLTVSHFLSQYAEGQRNFNGVVLKGANLAQRQLALISLEEANLQDSNLNQTNFAGAKLNHANLSGANLSQANLIGADLLKSNLAKANLTKALLTGANLGAANLRYADLRGASLVEANLGTADLTGAKLEGANLKGTNLKGIDLTYTDLEKVDLHDVDLSNTLLSKAQIRSLREAGIAVRDPYTEDEEHLPLPHDLEVNPYQTLGELQLSFGDEGDHDLSEIRGQYESEQERSSGTRSKMYDLEIDPYKTFGQLDLSFDDQYDPNDLGQYDLDQYQDDASFSEQQSATAVPDHDQQINPYQTFGQLDISFGDTSKPIADLSEKNPEKSPFELESHDLPSASSQDISPSSNTPELELEESPFELGEWAEPLTDETPELDQDIPLTEASYTQSLDTLTEQQKPEASAYTPQPDPYSFELGEWAEPVADQLVDDDDLPPTGGSYTEALSTLTERPLDEELHSVGSDEDLWSDSRETPFELGEFDYSKISVNEPDITQAKDNAIAESEPSVVDNYSNFEEEIVSSPFELGDFDYAQISLNPPNIAQQRDETIKESEPSIVDNYSDFEEEGTSSPFELGGFDYAQISLNEPDIAQQRDETIKESEPSVVDNYSNFEEEATSSPFEFEVAELDYSDISGHTEIYSQPVVADLEDSELSAGEVAQDISSDIVSESPQQNQASQPDLKIRSEELLKQAENFHQSGKDEDLKEIHRQQVLERLNTPSTSDVVEKYNSPLINSIQSALKNRVQYSFQASVIEAYDCKCAITGCNIRPILEAVLINPKAASNSDHPSNGLLLRTDLSHLFKLHLIAINPDNMSVLIAPSLKHLDYQAFEHKTISLPTNVAKRPNAEFLASHLQKCKWYAQDYQPQEQSSASEQQSSASEQKLTVSRTKLPNRISFGSNPPKEAKSTSDQKFNQFLSAITRQPRWLTGGIAGIVLLVIIIVGGNITGLWGNKNPKTATNQNSNITVVTEDQAKPINIKISQVIYQNQGMIANGNSYIPLELMKQLGINQGEIPANDQINYQNLTYAKAGILKEANIPLSWDADTRTMTIEAKSEIKIKSIDLKIKDKLHTQKGLIVNQDSYIPLDLIKPLAIESSQIPNNQQLKYEDETYIKVAALKDLGVTVGWNAETRTLSLD